MASETGGGGGKPYDDVVCRSVGVRYRRARAVAVSFYDDDVSAATMEAVLDEFYAQIVAKLERDELIPAYKRSQHREYLATVVDGLCGSWCGHDRRRACEAAVASAVAHHERAVRDNGSVCPLGKHHDMLYVMARFAMDGDAGTESVAALLTAVYTCEKTLEQLFEGAVVGSKVARMITGRRTDYGATGAENRAALGFFLDRATRARLLFDGLRFQDVLMKSYRAAPVVVAATSGNAAAVALLLRYGVADESARAAIAYLRDASDACRRPFAEPCLDVLLRAVVSERVIGDDADGERYGRRGDVVRSPPPLMHLARCAVRGALHEEFRLPHGIPQLPVPRSMVSYLDLEC